MKFPFAAAFPYDFCIASSLKNIELKSYWPTVSPGTVLESPKSHSLALQS